MFEGEPAWGTLTGRSWKPFSFKGDPLGSMARWTGGYLLTMGFVRPALKIPCTSPRKDRLKTLRDRLARYNACDKTAQEAAW